MRDLWNTFVLAFSCVGLVVMWGLAIYFLGTGVQ